MRTDTLERIAPMAADLVEIMLLSASGTDWPEEYTREDRLLSMAMTVSAILGSAAVALGEDHTELFENLLDFINTQTQGSTES